VVEGLAIKLPKSFRVEIHSLGSSPPWPRPSLAFALSAGARLFPFQPLRLEGAGNCVHGIPKTGSEHDDACLRFVASSRANSVCGLGRRRDVNAGPAHGEAVPFLCDAVFQHWLPAADLLQRQLAVFVVKLLEAVEAVAAS